MNTQSPPYLTTILIEFKWNKPLSIVENNGIIDFKNNETNQNLQLEESLRKALESRLSIKWSSMGRSWQKIGETNSYFTSLISENGSHCVFRVYNNIFLTVDFQGSPTLEAYLSDNQILDDLSRVIGHQIHAEPIKMFSRVPRHEPVDNRYFSSDNRLQIYDFDQVVAEVRSPYQHIKILRSKQFGNTLILDDFINLAEQDIAYTHGIMRKGVENFKDKNVLILGGGDGGILHEVMKESPKFVTMIDIDRMVVDLCKKHLRGACGSSMDEMSGPHHEIIISDCFPLLEKYVKEGRRFDYIFSDLTDVPLTSEGAKKHQEFWDLIKKVTTLTTELLKPDGKLLTHLIGLSDQKVIATYEQMLNSWPLEFERTISMVPSFLEMWVYYAIWKPKV